MLSTSAAVPAALLNDLKSNQSQQQSSVMPDAQQSPSTLHRILDHRVGYVNLQPQGSQRSQPAAAGQPRRDYANLCASESLDAPLSTSTSSPRSGAELSNPRLNYMELDFSTGRGQPCRPQKDQTLTYVELDFRAMSALAATVQAEREQAPTHFAVAGATGRRGFDRSSSSSKASPTAKASSLGRLRTSLAKSLSRFSLRRRGRREQSAASSHE